jgi:hypothetical protein
METRDGSAPKGRPDFLLPQEVFVGESALGASESGGFTALASPYCARQPPRPLTRARP